MNPINHKPMSIVLVILLMLSLAFVGCKRQAVQDLPGLPEEEGTADATAEAAGDEGEAILDLAEENTEQQEGEGEEGLEEDLEEGLEDPPLVTEETPESTEPTATEAPPEPTPEITTPEPTEVPTEEAPPEAETPAPTEEAAAVTGPQTHVVQAGENLFRIALRYGTTVERLAQVNGITNPARIHVGQKITIPGTGEDGETPPPSGDGATTHVVQAGENLFRIALRYNYDYFYLARYNGITNPATIYPGQVIKIPQN
ncbi:MAG: LysM peptidoglycan-binding domain-containing protein [Anaerolineales bacterium]